MFVYCQSKKMSSQPCSNFTIRKKTPDNLETGHLNHLSGACYPSEKKGPFCSETCDFVRLSDFKRVDEVGQ
jgi:hypothetical protein